MIFGNISEMKKGPPKNLRGVKSCEDCEHCIEEYNPRLNEYNYFCLKYYVDEDCLRHYVDNDMICDDFIQAESKSKCFDCDLILHKDVEICPECGHEMY